MEKTNHSYSGLASIYDRIMCSVDYEGWADYVEQLLARFAKTPRSLVDLACGTGSSALPFAARGYRVAGVDLSPAMLEIARKKANSRGLDVNFYKQDICFLELPEKYDLALLFQDGFNYITDEKSLSRAIEQVHAALQPASLFIFDLTRPGLRSGEHSSSVTYADQDDFAIILESRYNKAKELWSAELTVFLETGNGLYKKFREKHLEKDHDPDLVAALLNRAGFDLLGIYPSFNLDPAGPAEQKLTFVAERSC